MTLNILIDMNLSPDWVEALRMHGLHSIHWVSIGRANAPDSEIMAWARSNSHIVLTHDLDFGTMLALTHSTGPSVIQVRARNVLPDHLAPLVAAVLNRHEADLNSGALIVVDEARSRVRLLPL